MKNEQKPLTALVSVDSVEKETPRALLFRLRGKTLWWSRRLCRLSEADPSYYEILVPESFEIRLRDTETTEYETVTPEALVELADSVRLEEEVI